MSELIGGTTGDAEVDVKVEQALNDLNELKSEVML